MITKLPRSFASRTVRRLLLQQKQRGAATAAASQHWSGTLRYASPESDFTAPTQEELSTVPEWSHQLSFASPESDFTAPTQEEIATAPEWSQQYSFASPESDFYAHALPPVVSATSATVEAEWSQQLSFASPESDFYAHALPAPVEDTREADDLLLSQWLVASPESATGFVHAHETLTTPLQAELASIATPLPTSLQEALSQHERRAIVVTQATSPFKVVHVNQAWEGLCGYTQAEAQDQPIGELLKGPQTQVSQEMMEGLKEHPETPQVPVLLVNYTKRGRKFQNRLQVGPLFAAGESNGSAVEYLVGVLKEVPGEEEQDLQMAA